MSLLIQSSAQLREYVSFSGDLDYDTLKPAVRAAQTFLSRYVGPALIAELGTTILSANQTALLPYVQAPMSALALLKFVSAGNVRITDLGVMRTKTADSNDAFEWQLERTVQELKAQAFDGIEALLVYLDGKLTQFPAYPASEAYQRETGKLIRTASVFSLYYDIASSRLVFQTLLASMRTAELSVQKILGTTLTGVFSTDPLSELQAKQLDGARRALVYLTIARALREKLVSITELGVQVNGISNFGSLKYSNAPSDKQLATSLAYFDEQAALFLGQLSALIPVEPPATPQTGSRVRGTAIVAF